MGCFISYVDGAALAGRLLEPRKGIISLALGVLLTVNGIPADILAVQGLTSLVNFDRVKSNDGSNLQSQYDQSGRFPLFHSKTGLILINFL